MDGTNRANYDALSDGVQSRRVGIESAWVTLSRSSASGAWWGAGGGAARGRRRLCPDTTKRADADFPATAAHPR